MTHVHRTIGLARCTSSPLPPKAGRDLAGSSRRASWSTGRAHTFVIAGREVQQSVQAAGSLVARVAFTFFLSIRNEVHEHFEDRSGECVSRNGGQAMEGMSAEKI